jgi:hypothetical protein
LELHERTALWEMVNKHTIQGMTFGKYSSLNEDAKMNLADSVLDKLFTSAINKYDNIDFQNIPKSMGDITSMKEFPNLVESINLLQKICVGNGIKCEEIDIVLSAKNNLVNLKEQFRTGFLKKNAYVVMLYNTLTLALFEAVTLIITVMVDFINDIGGTDTYEVTMNREVYKRSKNRLLLDTLRSFNSAFADGSIRGYISNALKSATIHESVTAVFAGVAATLTAIYLGTKVVPLLRELIYLFYYSRMKISDAAQIQSEFLKTNIETLEYRGASKKVVTRQKNIVNTLNKISRIFAIDYENSENKASNMLRSEEKVSSVNDAILI